MTEISDALNMRNNINLRARVAKKGQVREVNTKYGPSSVCEFTLEDDTGSITLSVWGEKIANIGVGQTVEITDAYTTNYKGNVQLNVPKTGTLVVT